MPDHEEILTEIVVLSDLMRTELEGGEPDWELLETCAESMGVSAEFLLTELED